MTTSVDEFLAEQGVIAHYGVLGMKWGVRKDRRRSGSPRRTRREQREIESRKQAVKRRRTLSEKEIRQRIERLHLERQLKELTEQDISPGKSFVTNLFKDVGKRTLATIGTGAVLFAIKSALEGRWDPKAAAQYLAPRPKR